MNSEEIRRKLQKLIENFEAELQTGSLRDKVLKLIPCFKQLRKLGKSLIEEDDISSARDRILFYLKGYNRRIINGNEMMVVSGIQDYPRRIRELRVQFGWSIVSGKTAKEMAAEKDFNISGENVASMKPSDYILLSTKADRDAAYRWNIANTIRRKKKSVSNKLLDFFKENVGKEITGEELRYIAKGKTEWARRVRELRTEQGWPVVTKNTGRPDLDVGVYLLEADRQSPVHDRVIPDPVKRKVLRRDKYTCQKCGWSHDMWNRSDPRHLELHHKKHHVDGGKNDEENLITICTVCHDEIHSKQQ